MLGSFPIRKQYIFIFRNGVCASKCSVVAKVGERYADKGKLIETSTSEGITIACRTFFSDFKEPGEGSVPG